MIKHFMLFVVLVASYVAPIPVAQTYNMAGYYALIAGNGSSSITMSWTVPAVGCLKNGQAITGSVAIFPALDANKNSLLAQIGTESGCNKGIASYDAWYEYSINIPATTIKNTVASGDRMTGEVYYDGAGNYTFSLVDQGRWSYSKTIALGISPIPAQFDWDVEYADWTQSTFPSFGVINLTSCQWVQGTGSSNPLSNGQKLTREDMVESIKDTPLAAINTYYKATTSSVTNGNSFTVMWQNW